MKTKATWKPDMPTLTKAAGSEGAFSPALEPSLKKILVPVDFSECSEGALRYAAGLARRFQAEVVLLHVIEPTPPQATIFEAVWGDANLEAEATKALSECSGEFRSQLRIRTEVRHGYAHRQIVLAAKEHDVDLIVVGTHGRKGLAHLLLGSAAEIVVREAPCTVLVVRDRGHAPLTPAGAKNTSVGPVQE